MNDEKMFRKLLSDQNAKITKPRLELFRILKKEGLLSISELTEKTKQDMDRVSVYRTTELFERIGIIKRVNIGWKYKIELSDIFLGHHHHMVCEKCNKIVPSKEDSRIEEIISELSDGSDFKITSHQLELNGLCRECRPGTGV